MIEEGFESSEEWEGQIRFGGGESDEK